MNPARPSLRGRPRDEAARSPGSASLPHWGEAYHFTVADGRYPAMAEFGSGDKLSAEDPEALLAKIRRHYQPELLQATILTVGGVTDLGLEDQRYASVLQRVLPYPAAGS